MIVLLMLLGAGIVYLALQQLYRKEWMRNLDVEIDFKSDYAVMGQQVELVEKITNRKWLPLSYVNVKFKVDSSMDFGDTDSNSTISDNSYRNDIFSLMYYQRVTRNIQVTCTKRGVYRIQSMEVVSSGVFMNDVMVAMYPVDTAITVYPKEADVSMLEIPFSKIMGIVERNSHIYEDKFMFRGIREYQVYDPMNTINWNATARAGNLMVNQYNESTSQEVCILLNLESEGMLINDKVLEESISIAAGLSRMLIENGIQVSLVSNGCAFDTGEYVNLESEGGISQFNKINTALAEIDLKLKMPEYVKVVDECVKPQWNTLYVMISTNTRSVLQRKMTELCINGADALWIRPHLADSDVRLDSCDALQIDWEVNF